MDDTSKSSPRQLWTLTLAAAAILLITMGVRQTSGLFLIPITQSTGISIVAMSFALAVGQFMFGAAQPVFGAIADKFGAEKVVIAGAIMLALGCVLTPLAKSSTGLLLTMGVLSAAGAAAGSFRGAVRVRAAGAAHHRSRGLGERDVRVRIRCVADDSVGAAATAIAVRGGWRCEPGTGAAPDTR
jgi:MFS family permease